MTGVPPLLIPLDHPKLITVLLVVERVTKDVGISGTVAATTSHGSDLSPTPIELTAAILK